MPPDSTSMEGQPVEADSNCGLNNDTTPTSMSNPAVTQSNVRKQYIFLIRHGDRWDYSHPEWKQESVSRTGDSPLSPLGHQQARELGVFLDSYWNELGLFSQGNSTNNNNIITWMSSPFLRCLQTSNDALNAMPLANAQYQQKNTFNLREIPILPEYSIFEWDGHGGEWHKDLPPLEERKHYFPRLQTDHQSFFVPQLPEPRSVFFDRCQRAVDAFHERYPLRQNEDDDDSNDNIQVFCMVSHAAGCLALAKTFAQVDLQEITPAGPCSIYMLTRSTNTKKWILDEHDAPHSMNGYTDHLSEIGTTTKPWSDFGDGTTKFYTGPSTSRFHPDKLD